MTLWVAIAVAGLATFGVRLLSLAYLPPAALPPLVRDALRFVMPAVLSAIIAPAALFTGEDKTFALPHESARVIAAAVAAGVVWFGQRRLPAGRQVWLTIAVGMATLWAWKSVT